MVLKMAFLCAALGMATLTGCSSTTPEELKAASGDLPGVIEARVGEEDCTDCDGPAQRTVTVSMEPDASVDEVFAVFDSYREEIDDGDLVSVSVRLETDICNVLVAGEGVQMPRDVVADFVTNLADERVMQISRQVVPAGPEVLLRLEGAGLEEVIEIYHRYDGDPSAEFVSIVSGSFYVGRFTLENAEFVDARAAFAADINRRVPLTGAWIGDDGKLYLLAAPEDLERLRTEVAVLENTTDIGAVKILTKDFSRQKPCVPITQEDFLD